MLVRSSSTRLGTKLGRQVWLLLVTLAMFFFTLRLALFGEARRVLVLLLLAVKKKERGLQGGDLLAVWRVGRGSCRGFGWCWVR